MFKKMAALILTVSLIQISVCGAAASEIGLFGELSLSEGADERLAVLEEIAEQISVSLSTDRFHVEVSQAYYEGNRIYVSYHAEGSRIAVQDGLGLEEDAYADIIAGEEIKREDGSVIGWKECIVPDENASDVQTFSLVFSDSDEPEERNRVSFTLNRNHYDQYLQGTSPAKAYQAEAEMFMGKVDLKGFVRLVSAEQAASWIAWQEGGEETGTDSIGCWILYRDGNPVSADLYGAFYINDMDEITYELMFPRMDDLNGLMLVPEYTRGGEKPEEAIALEPAVR